MPPSTRRSARSRKRVANPSSGSATRSFDEKMEIQSLGDTVHPVASSISGSETELADAVARKKARVTFSMDAGSQSSPTSTSENQSKDIASLSKDSSGKLSHEISEASARAQRSLRRQTNVDKDMEPVARSYQKVAHLKKQMTDFPSFTTKRKVNNNEEVVKIKFNTGTLLLYKGLNRRAVFLRRC